MRVTYEVADSVALISMDDGKVNALNFEMLAELDATLDRAQKEEFPVVLTGRDGIFSAGFDLQVVTAGGANAAELFRKGFELSYRMLSFPRPLVIACTGHALAMGAFLLLSGDYRIGTTSSAHKIAANEVAIGLTMPRSAIEVARQRVPDSHLNRLIVLAEVLTSKTAIDAGLLDETVPEAELRAAAISKATELSKLHLSAFAATKLRLRGDALSRLLSAMEADHAELGLLSGSENA
jgi:enoyl-CoA hydratase